MEILCLVKLTISLPQRLSRRQTLKKRNMGQNLLFEILFKVFKEKKIYLNNKLFKFK